jgi:lipopolysaccharide biosynthesis regulator YciM
MNVIILTWIKENPLTVFSGLITMVLIYYYVIEKGRGVKLSKKYRNSIFEVQSRIFLNATKHLISGHKDLAIKEFLNAVELNKETIDTYFALGRLFRSNGEIEKAVSIHRSIIARDNILESTRLEGLKELGKDFDKGGFLDKATQAYKDVLKINKEQVDVIKDLCRIYEDLEDWDEALNYRMMLSKLSSENQSQTISHIFIEQAKSFFEKEQYSECWEKLEQAFRYGPSVSAKILQLKYYLVLGKLDEGKKLLVEIVKVHELYISNMFDSLEQFKSEESELNEKYQQRLSALKDYFLELEGTLADDKSSIFISKVNLLKEKGELETACKSYEKWFQESKVEKTNIFQIDYARILIALGRNDEAIKITDKILEGVQKSNTKHFCSNCGFSSDEVFWRCPQCYEWETIQFRLEV